ncbi:SH3 domain-binding protein 5-like, partial [Pollicipes pollicipes]|uniref:SH3 domain-binding protein 5-like n=1 Tax=Pollicipes pollicipes TaxID=41117 RepID=UPI0018859ED0
MSFEDFDSQCPIANEHVNRLEFINPQIQVELEQLNSATDNINKLELELDDARAQFRSLLIESTQKIDALAKKLGSCVEKSRPYYEARIKAKQALQRTHDAAVRYERASSHHQAAKELVALAEEGLTTQGHTFDQSWQEMLNHSTEKVNSAEHERTQSAKNHELCSREYQLMEGEVKQLQKDLKREIARSRMGVRRSLLSMNTLVNTLNLQMLPYFEMKAHFNQLMEMQKRQVSDLEAEVQATKITYAETLRRLEEISNGIHEARGLGAAGCESLGVRGAGVG